MCFSQPAPGFLAMFSLLHHPHEQVSQLGQFFLDNCLLVKKLARQFLNKNPCQGKFCQISPHTRANKTCQGKPVK